MSQIQELLPELLLRVPELSDPLGERYLKRGAKKWFEESATWRPRLDPLFVFDGIDEYQFSLPQNTFVHQVFWVKIDGNPLQSLTHSELVEGRLAGVFIDSEGGIHLSKRTPRGELTAEVSIAPSTTNSEIPDPLFERHYDALLGAALIMVLSTPNQPWTNFPVAEALMVAMDSKVLRAKRAAGGRLNQPLKVVYGGL